jgi:hypothetical protein
MSSVYKKTFNIATWSLDAAGKLSDDCRRHVKMSLDMQDMEGNWIQLWNERYASDATTTVHYEGLSLTRVDVGEYP